MQKIGAEMQADWKEMNKKSGDLANKLGIATFDDFYEAVSNLFKHFGQ